MAATADPTEDGTAYILNGEKLWCTNGPIAEIMVVMARTPAPRWQTQRHHGVHRRMRTRRAWRSLHRCEFMGLRGIENGVITFTNVRVPKENMLWGEGKGLKLALITLNTGRLTIPATCAAAGKWCVEGRARLGNERAAVGRAGRQTRRRRAEDRPNMAAYTFAMEAVARAVRRPRRCRQIRHPPRSRDREDVQLRSALARRR